VKRVLSWMLAAAALGGLAARAHAELIEIQWDAGQQFQRTVELAPGKFVEVCGKLRAPSTVDWRFESTGKLDFNVHYHEGKEVRFPARQDGVAKLSGQLVVQSDQDYCWMWTSKGAKPASLTLELKKTG